MLIKIFEQIWIYLIKEYSKYLGGSPITLFYTRICSKTLLFMSKIYTLLFLLACAWHTTAQITGTVTDASGFELPGVTVQVVGANTGTVTDINGKYSIQVNNFMCSS